MTRHLPTPWPIAKPTAFLSFDIEALLIRAPDRHVDRLIWGKTARGEYGLKRLCAILREHRLKGNFLVDLAGCAIYGDGPMRAVLDYILEEGHELHAHLHPEMLADAWEFTDFGVSTRRFHDHGRPMATMLLEYTAAKFRQLTGRTPFLFRSGGYLFNQETLHAAKEAGFAALSNYNLRWHAKMTTGHLYTQQMEPFWWDNGLLEIPVDISSPENMRTPSFLKKCATLTLPKTLRTCNLVFHSWTLLSRNDAGYCLDHAPRQEERFRQICHWAARLSRVQGYEEYAKEAVIERVFPTAAVASAPASEITGARRCQRCHTLMPRKRMASGSCPGCGSHDLIEIPHPHPPQAR